MPTSALLFAISLVAPTPIQQEARPPQLIWGDLDRDGLDEALVLGPRGQVLLLGNRGEGRLEDVTARSGLDFAEFATCALIADFDGDGLNDVFLGSGEHRLWRNLGEGALQPFDSDVEHDWIDLEALALDHDRDGKLDLHLHTEAGDVLYRNVGQGRFERVQLPGADHPAELNGGVSVDAAGELNLDADSASPAQRRYRRWLSHRASNTGRASRGNGASAALAGGPAMSATNIGSLPLAGLPSMICAGTIVDQATTQCIEASSVPTLGELYPLSSAFNLSSATNFVGINTTAPAYRLHVVDDLGPAIYAEGWDWGVRGKTFSATGAGLHGEGPTTGVRGEAVSAGPGNRIGGEFTASGGTNNIGVRGTSTIGVHGVGSAYGALGETNTGSSTGVFGRANHTSGVTTGVLGEVASTSGTAVLGQATALTGVTYGVRGTTASTTGAGVRGEGPVTGVRGDANKTGGAGDRFGGHFSASGGSNNVGVFSFSTTGVQGVGTTYGVRGSASAVGGVGLAGDATAVSGNSVGVRGVTTSPTGAGVVGANITTGANAVGVLGSAGSLLVGANAVGVRGVITNIGGTSDGVGVEGVHDAAGVGVRGVSATGTGILGQVTAASGNPIGVQGETSANFGVGVMGLASSSSGITYGVQGLAGSPDGAGVYGRNTSTDSTAVGVLGNVGFLSGVGENAAGVRGTVTNLLGTDDGIGVEGVHSAGGVGVRGVSASGNGVVGTGYTGVLGHQSGVPSVAGFYGSSGLFGLGSTGAVGVSAHYNNSGTFGGSEFAGPGSSAGMIARNFNDPAGWGLLGDDGSGALQPADGPAGVLGVDSRDNGAGVIGVHRSTAGVTPGIEGLTNSTDIGASAVIGRTTHASASDTIGVVGLSTPQAFHGIGGHFSGGWEGVRGEATIPGVGIRAGGSFEAEGGTLNYGVMATASGAGARAIYASASSGGGGLAGQFSGNVTVSGTLSKGGGSFKIDHPLDPQNKYLYHSFVESPDMMNVYNGNVALDGGGEAWVQLPDWFESLNRDFRYQLTPIGAPGLVFVKREMSGNRFQVGGPPGLRVSWQITGIRKDPFANANRIEVEVDKPTEERGLYLHNEAYGLPREQSIDYVLNRKPQETKQISMEATRAAQQSLWAEQAEKTKVAEGYAARWAALGLPPPRTAVAIPDPDVFLREHPEYREQVVDAAARTKGDSNLRRTDKKTGTKQASGSDKR